MRTMNKFVELLNLPDPSDQIKQRAYNIIGQWQHNQKFIDNLKRYVLADQTINVASSGQILDNSLTEMVREQYQSFFEFPIEAALSFFNNQQSQPACLPPHTHPKRTIALQYYFDTGAGARTVLYDFNRTCTPSRFMDYYDYSDVTYMTSTRFEKERWYMFDTRTPHSVEDINGHRMFIAFTFDSNHTIESVLQNSKLQYRVCEEIK